MKEDGINPHYAIFCDGGNFGILGTELSSGETVSIPVMSENRELVEELINILNEKAVSVHHAKDVIRDRLCSLV